MATNSFERVTSTYKSEVSRLAASYNFLIKVIFNKDVSFPVDRGSVVASSGMFPPKDLLNLYVGIFDCFKGDPFTTLMAFSLSDLRSLMFRDLIARFGSKNHGRREWSSGKGRYPMTVLHVVVESGEFGREPELLVLTTTFFRFDANGTQPDLLSSSSFDKTWRVEVQGKTRLIECRTRDFIAICLE